ncbi:hypothetical protein P153DRAFT_378826 [Dothidotthia symphoricarpi CBS 119687]|uniref:Zn(2)-C6 fungal-type domain-containing protein n=1 Tax=Dothidotthia symphoricarpi CBS 119687 TaxID=1392245 RepID=A0A6A6A444_9PLEO|nr:uncharacterized protein P153DRAFT_378826 [Dothidotthia symphoricarpi CBS 119687]KAF2125361.1 hypothetical protein P153DRAFT_378826 [Dothidotthia symphoricarpi CBS 119687]
MPSHPGSTSSYDPYPAPHAGDAQLEMIVPSQHAYHMDITRTQNNTQQLPSLRAVLEPELLDTKLPGQPSRVGGTQVFHSTSVRYESDSPTLKRRLDLDTNKYGYSDRSTVVPQPPFAYRPPLLTSSSSNSFAVSSTQGSTSSAVIPELQRRESFAHISPHDQTGEFFRPSSTPSDPVASHLSRDELGETGRSVRRRPDGSSVSSRATVKASRCIGQREVPGEGICYFYEDGTYCRVVIDGEPVNPSWGITKAGKPRKRLAQACLTCREKKIKCEPGYPKCHQCSKSQRICKGGLSQSSVSSASGEPSPSSPPLPSKNASTELSSSAAGSDKEKTHKESHEPFIPRKNEFWHAGTPFNPQSFRPQSVATTGSVYSYESDLSGVLNGQELDGRTRGSYLHMELQWEQDPYKTDPKLTMELLDLYFLHVGRPTYNIFPRVPFLSWVESGHEKNPDHIMLLYSVLALGSLFSSNLELQALGNRFASIATYALAKRFGKFDLQMCQSRLILSLYNYGQGKSQAAWDFTGAALRALSALRLNTEEGVKKTASDAAALEYGIESWTYEECCRRTFWSAFLMDRYNANQGGTFCGINTEDIHVRMPCLENMYETSKPCEAPLFSYDLLDQPDPQQPPLGHMAYLCLISVIWGDVMTYTGRAIHRPEGSFERNYTVFYDKSYSRLKAWVDMLPEHLRYSPQNLDKSIVEGYAGSFVSIHALYHVTVLRVNRYVRVRAMSTHIVRRNIDRAFRCASSFVSIMQTLAVTTRRQRLPTGTATDFQFSTPFSAEVLMLSIDVLTSTGTFHSLPSLIETVNDALSCTDELSSFWASAQAHHRTITTRLKQLRDIAAQAEQKVNNDGQAQFWTIADSLDTAFGRDDVVYGTEDQLRFDTVAKLAECRT